MTVCQCFLSHVRDVSAASTDGQQIYHNFFHISGAGAQVVVIVENTHSSVVFSVDQQGLSNIPQSVISLRRERNVQRRVGGHCESFCYPTFPGLQQTHRSNGSALGNQHSNQQTKRCMSFFSKSRGSCYGDFC